MANTPNQTQSKKYDKNEFSITGRLTKDPEVRNSSAGQYGMFTIANNRGDNTNFFTFFVKETQIPFMTQYFKKGSLADVTGTIVPSVETQADGTKKTVMKLIVSKMGLTGVPNYNGTPTTNTQFANNQTAYVAPPTAVPPVASQVPQQQMPQMQQPMYQQPQQVVQQMPQAPVYNNPVSYAPVDDDDLPF